MADRFTPRRGDVRDPGPSENPDAGRYDGQSDDMEGAQADQGVHGAIVAPTSDNAGSRPTGVPSTRKTRPDQHGDYLDGNFAHEPGGRQPSHSDAKALRNRLYDPMQGGR